jgi:hypothetical protein
MKKHPLDIPAFLILTAEQRAEGWRKCPPRPPRRFGFTSRKPPPPKGPDGRPLSPAQRAWITRRRRAKAGRAS